MAENPNSLHAAPQQYKQSSRKGKKAWRKHVDISNVQTGLEHLRDEEITGGPVVEKPSSAIFAIDTAGSDSVRKKLGNARKALRVDEILARRSAVPAVSARKRRNPRVTDGIVQPLSKKHHSNWVAKQEVQELRSSLHKRNHLSSDSLVPDEGAIVDLWSEEQPSQLKASYGGYVAQPKAKVMPSTLSRPPIAMTANGRSVPAVKIPAGGVSYNPRFDDWDELLRENGEAVVQAEKIRLRNEQLEAEREARVAATQLAITEAERSEDESAWEGFETDGEQAESLLKKRPARKTPAQRNKTKRRKEAERQALHESKMATKKTQARQLEQLFQERRQVAKDGGEASTADIDPADPPPPAADGDDNHLRKRPMRNVRIPDKTLALVLPDELQDSLRRLKPEGSLLDDRFRHLLVNGKIEARRPVSQPRKRKVTYTEKWTHKDFRIAT